MEDEKDEEDKTRDDGPVVKIGEDEGKCGSAKQNISSEEREES